MKRILLSLVAIMAAMTSFAQVTLADLAGTYKGTAHSYGDDNVEASFTLTYADEALTLTSITFGNLAFNDLSLACTLENGVLSIGGYYDDSYDYISIDASEAEVVDKNNLKFSGENAFGLYYINMDTFDEYSYWFNTGDIVKKDESSAISQTYFVKESNSRESYNLAGQRVGAQTNGIIIKNGRKYLVK